MFEKQQQKNLSRVEAIKNVNLLLNRLISHHYMQKLPFKLNIKKNYHISFCKPYN